MHTHTPWTHTWSSGQPFLCCDARGAVGDSVPCSRAPQSWYWDNPCWSWDSNLRPLGYEPVSLTIRPWLHHKTENNIMERMLKEWRIYILLPGKVCILMAWKYKDILERYSKQYYTFSFSLLWVVFMFQRRKNRVYLGFILLNVNI